MSVANISPEPGQTEEPGGSVVVASMDPRESPNSWRMDGGRNSTSEAQDSTAGKDQSSPPPKRTKRGKYISRACTACQQRKIKCEGGEPCAHCKARGRVCISTATGQPRQAPKTSTSSSVDAARSSQRSSSSIDQDLAARVALLESRLDMMQQSAGSPVKYTAARTRRDSRLLRPVLDNDSCSPVSAQLQRVLEPDGQSFAGELSMNADLVEVDGSLSEESTDNTIRIAVDLIQDKASGNKSTRKVRGWLEDILERYDVVANESEWRLYMELFFEEIHVLYPIVHPPSVWEIFDGLWEYSALWPMIDPTEREEKRLAVALVCFCLALGRCCVSTRMADATGVHSSGWSICSVGMELLQDSERISKTGTTSLLAMQVLLLRIMYWFRLDATQESTRLVAIAVSNAHFMGIYQQSRLEAMPCYRSQLLCRVWWCIFILDRRMAMESGRPFLLQESNTDALLPLNLSDEWLSRYTGRLETTKMLESEIKKELAENHTTTIPYLVAMVRYSRVVGKAWELIYGLKASSNESASHIVDYADTVLSNLLDTLPEELAYNPDLPIKTQFGNRKRWQIKQTMLLSTCVTFLRILIRRPSALRRGSTDLTSDEELESQTICTSLAMNILNAHQNLNDNSMKYCFPYCHYLTSCTMVMISLVANEPALQKRHREAILAATRSLRLYCHTIWVSGKMMRWVSKLTLIARRVLGVEPGLDACQKRRMSDAPHDKPATSRAGPPTSSNNNDDDGESSSYLRQENHTSVSKNPESKADHHGVPNMWMPDGAGNEGGVPELPEWVMTNFNFETIGGEVSGPGGSTFKFTGVGSEEMPDSGINLEMGMGETMLHSIPTGMYNFDMSIT